MQFEYRLVFLQEDPETFLVIDLTDRKVIQYFPSGVFVQTYNIDVVDMKLFALIHDDFKRDHSLRIIRHRIRNGSKIEVT